ncbi:Adenosine monophosphate-protein transferase SoFic [Tritonibacter multivorans]|uniref:Adenosine monophosphate-protein transferase SoFic n=1 Tax=Tritonibacter multivorans TaxID=928856 RepID=A0A0N7LZD8_9RHOB|nr:Fic family protein [Tritonibacter multivorans]MDA7421267.1 Fic family protein [Tritonibacter multivorans]CUH77385.1 Adenosine monophosphate-protein transferase SoFic [Tritonibacter multivorans]SFD31250.1 Fic family protein [Tritonibacter multivorans]
MSERSLKQTYNIPSLPPNYNFDTLPILKALNAATRALAEVKGRAPVIPNQGILIDTLSLQEAKESSEIENIVTTNDELFRGSADRDTALSGPSKEVAVYRDALRLGFEHLCENGLLTNRTLIEMFRLLKNRSDGFRKLPGTGLQNNSGEIVYVPTQEADLIDAQMAELEIFINSPSELDPLISMAIIHHQFESIHPFPDGNGRLGRMLNVLYLTKEGLLGIPILYMSRGINETKSDYYRLLQEVRDTGNWEDWVVYMLNIVTRTAKLTLDLIEGIRIEMAFFKDHIRSEHRKIYSQDLINNLFRHPYTRIEFVMDELGVSRPTATSYLEKLSADEKLPLMKIVEGRNNYYVNVALVELLSGESD